MSRIILNKILKYKVRVWGGRGWTHFGLNDIQGRVMNTVMKRRAGQLWRNLNRSATINFPIKKTLHPELVSEFISKPALLWGSYRSFARRYANLWKGTVSFVMSVRPSVLLRLLLKALQLQGSCTWSCSAFSTNSFHFGRFLMQSLQFVIFIFVMSLFTSSSHLFSGN